MHTISTLAKILTVAFFTQIFYASQCDESVIVEIKSGKLEGSVVTAENGFKVNEFLGIQYGRVMEHFTKPVPVQHWKETKQAKSLPPRCFQFFKSGRGDEIPFELPTDTEDCLFANVFAPHEKSTKGYPVMIFIHGGGYNLGSTHEYGLEGITNWIVPKGVVFVNFHYRLGAFGFFSTGTEDAPGNYGLWDQQLLLQWVNDNIQQFGGDPTKITVFGESAGAFSTSLLTLSPKSRSLFQQAILLSGSAFSFVALSDNVVHRSASLAKKLGCNQNAPNEWLTCVKSKSASEIRAAEVGPEPTDVANMLIYAPRFDSDFFPNSLENLLQDAPKIPIIIGATNDEMMIFLLKDIESALQIADPENFSFAELRTRIYFIFALMMRLKNADLITDIAVHHYIDSVGNRNNATFLIEAYKEFNGDLMFYVPAHKEAMLRLAKGDKVWLYTFEYYNSDIYSSAGHMFDLWYLFKFSAFRRNVPYSKEEEKVAEHYSTLLTNFAKFGNPTPEKVNSVIWTPLSNSSSEVYLKIAKTLEMGNLWHRRGASFWNELIPKIEGAVLNAKPSEASETKDEL